MNVREFYNETANIYDLRHTNAWTKRLREVEVELLEKYARGAVLDVGCGTGYHLAWLAQSKPNCSLTGLDISAKMLEIARKNVSCRLIESAAEHLPFDDGSFDTILCLFTVLNLCDCDKALAEFYRVLKPGGKLILSVASVWENGGKLVRRFRIDGYILRFHLFKAEELKAAIEQAGFGIAHFDSIFRATRPRWGDWQSKVVEDLKQPAERGAMYLYVLGKPVSPV